MSENEAVEDLEPTETEGEEIVGGYPPPAPPQSLASRVHQVSENLGIAEPPTSS